VDFWRVVDVVKSAVGPFEQQVDPAGFPTRFLFSMQDDPALQQLQFGQVLDDQLQPFIGEEGTMCCQHLLPVVSTLHGS
jgi:hypothetical protein